MSNNFIDLFRFVSFRFSISNAQDEIVDVLANNFDTPSAMTRLQDLVHWINSHMNYDVRENEVWEKMDSIWIRLIGLIWLEFNFSKFNVRFAFGCGFYSLVARHLWCWSISCRANESSTLLTSVFNQMKRLKCFFF